MKANQKYFPLLDPAGTLTHRFLIVSNIAPADPSRVIEGNERVVRPRLADAKFFFDQDRRNTLASRVAALDRVVYHGKLGSQGERVRRVQAIAGALVAAAGGDAELAGQADRAALLAKAKPGLRIVNCGRGGIIDEAALLDALKRERDATYAALEAESAIAAAQ